MYFDEGDNNDGITVIDITDLDRVRYCFVLWDGCDVFSQDEDANILQLTPLSGSLYLGAYYNSNEQEERVDLQELVRRFDSWDLISSSALRDAWPEGDWQDNPGNDKDSVGEYKSSYTSFYHPRQTACIPAPILSWSCQHRLVYKTTQLHRSKRKIKWNLSV